MPLAWWVARNSSHSQQYRTHAFGWLTLSSPTYDDSGSDDPAAEEDKDNDDEDEEEDDDEDKLKAVVKAQQLSAEENRVLENIWQGDFSSLEQDWEAVQIKASNPNDDDDDDKEEEEEEEEGGGEDEVSVVLF